MKRFLFLLMAGVCLITSACAAENKAESTPEASGEYYTLDTVCTQWVYGGDAQTAADEVRDMLTRITEEMSMNEGSDLYKINSAAPQAVTVSDETAGLISTALDFAKNTNGAFDPTIGIISSLWDITGAPRVPSQSELDAALPLVDYTGVTVNGNTVSLAKSGMMLDLGAIGKGYAADQAVEIYKKYGVQSALLNLGGNVYAYGAKTDGSSFRIGLRDPYGSENEYAAVVSVKNTSVVTSGVYERYFESNGVTYHHLFDPKTGYPTENGLVAVTVVCASSTTADALSTALFVMGLEDGLKFAESQPGVEAAFFTNDKKIYVTDGLKGNIEISNEAYTLKS